jgi:hypothetical protein
VNTKGRPKGSSNIRTKVEKELRKSVTVTKNGKPAQNAAHAAFAGRRTVTPKSRDGMIESLRVLKACQKAAVAARRIALQMIHNTIVRIA